MFDHQFILQKDHEENQNMDFKYVLQDSGSYMIGAKFSYEELLEQELVPFKFKAIVDHYIAKDTSLETTLESQMYYMTTSDFSFRTYEQLKTKIKVTMQVQKRSLFGKEKSVYEEEILSLRQFCEMNLAKKKASGVMIREVIISKLALMGFSV